MAADWMSDLSVEGEVDLVQKRAVLYSLIVLWRAYLD